MDRYVIGSQKVVDEKVLIHYGMPRRSGRYPWGSGEDPYQHTPGFYANYLKLKKEGLDDKTIAAGMGLSMAQLKDLNYYELSQQGLDEKEIASRMGISTTELRSYQTIAKAYGTIDDVAMVWQLKNKGWSQTAIAERLGVTEGTVRNLLKPGADAKAKATVELIEMVKKAVDEKGVVDVGGEVERYLHISKTKFDAIVANLEDEGYHLYHAKQLQAGTGLYTSIRVLCKPDMAYYGEGGFKEQFEKDPAIVKSIGLYSDDIGDGIKVVKPPVDIDRSRVFVRYGDQGGTEKDGLIEIRPGVEDIDLMDARYAQVRISVDGDKYMKGMAIRSDDIPEGYDIVYNTNKKTGAPDEKVFKHQGSEDSPFGAIVYQKEYVGADGETHQSALNIVNEEGDWNSWSRNLASQFLSKQTPELAKQQLQISTDARQEEFDKIMALTNPTVRKKLLDEFAESCDADAVHLKAAALPRQRTQVIIPVPDLPDNEIYAPNFKDGETVVLVRFPHGGPFESPELKVNNKNPAAKALLGQALDAVGINSKVAERLSGADFDGDTVVVLPNNSGAVKTAKPLALLDGFDPKASFPLSPDSPELKKTEEVRTSNKNREMGVVSNLITDMTIKGADSDEIARAVAHSMVVIDSVKHDLDYKASYDFYGIEELKQKYQSGGASTIVSRAKSDARVVKERELTSTWDMTPEEKAAWDRGEKVYRQATKNVQITDVSDMTKEEKKVYEMGKKVYREVPVTKMKQITDPSKMTAEELETYNAGKKVWRDTGELVTQAKTKMSVVKDAAELSSGTKIESYYVEYANSMKTLANEARAASRSTPNLETNPSAKKTYAAEVESLQAKLNVAEMNRPKERQAQLIAQSQVNAMKAANPDMGKDTVKKSQTRALQTARERLGASKKDVEVQITPKEWEAIQAGAVSNTLLSNILKNTDMDVVRNYAMPKAKEGLSSSQVSRIQSMYNRGMTYADIADSLGVSVGTVQSALAKA